MMSTPSGRVALKTSGDMDLTSMGRVEAKLCVASDGRSCGYFARRRVRRWETAAWASGSVSVQIYEENMPPQRSAILRGRLGIEYAGICPSAGRAQWKGLVGSLRGGVSELGEDAGAWVAGRVGMGRCGFGASRPPNWSLVEGGVCKKCVCAGASRQVALMAGARIEWIRSWQRNGSRPLALAIRTNSAGHFAGERSGVALSECLCAGTNLMCPAGVRVRVHMVWWPRIAAGFHGVSSHTGRVKTTKKGVFVNSEEANAWRAALSMSSGSYSGLAIREPFHRKRKDSINILSISSSRNAEHYVIPPVMEQLRGMPNNSVVVKNVRSRAC